MMQGVLKVVAGSRLLSRGFSRYYELHKKEPLIFRSEDEIDEYVVKLFKTYFRTVNQPLMTIRSHYRELGLDELDKLEITLKLEDELGLEVPQETFEKFSTLKSVATFIAGTGNYRK